VLGSKSAARRQLLEAAGVPVVVDPAEVDERAIEAAMPGADAEAVAQALSREKALEVSRRRCGELCLGADQVLSLDGEALHKAATFDEARIKLARLSGRAHRLTSAFALARDGRIVAEGRDAATLQMRPLDAQAIEVYLAAAGEAALSSVGAYQLESLGVHLFERIDGAHSTILGLPVLHVLAALRAEGALAI
jgi:septum formation protein